MASATLKTLRFTLPILFLSSLVLHVNANAKTNKSSELPKKEAPAPRSSVPDASEGSMNFNTESSAGGSENRPAFKFKDGSDDAQSYKSPNKGKYEPLPEDQPFRTYVGYPKYQLGGNLTRVGVGSKWSYQGQDFNFNTSAIGYGADFRIQATPQIRVDVNYFHYSLAMDAVTLGNTLAIVDSKEDFDSYFVKTNYCFISEMSFFRQFCIGGDIGSDSYPILGFISSSRLELTKVSDIILGLNLSFQWPFSDILVGRLTGGYNYGTGLGNEGTLSSKNNSSFFAKLGAEWTLARRHSLLGNFEFKIRNATLEGTNGSNFDSWETKSSTVGLGVGYLYTF